MTKILHYLIKDPKLYGNYGVILTMGSAGFISSTVPHTQRTQCPLVKELGSNQPALLMTLS